MSCGENAIYVTPSIMLGTAISVNNYQDYLRCHEKSFTNARRTHGGPLASRRGAEIACACRGTAVRPGDKWVQAASVACGAVTVSYSIGAKRGDVPGVLPKWAAVRLGDVTHAEVQHWVTTLTATHSPSTVTKVHRVLSLILDMAVKDGRLARNVSQGVNLPRTRKPEHRYLTHDQVEDLANECGYPSDPSKHSSRDIRANETYRLVVLFLTYTGFVSARWRRYGWAASTYDAGAP